MTTEQVNDTADLEKLVADAEAKIDPAQHEPGVSVEPVIEPTDEPIVAPVVGEAVPMAPEPAQPTEVSAPVAEPTPAPVSQELRQLRQRLAQSEQQNQFSQQQRQTDQVEQRALTEASQYYSELINEGLPQETAQRIAAKHYQSLGQIGQAASQGQMMQAESAAKLETARGVARQYGADPMSLMNLNTPEDMIREASRTQELNGFRNRVEALEKGRVGTQQMDNNRGATSSSDEAFTIEYANGSSNDHERWAKIQARLSDRPIIS